MNSHIDKIGAEIRALVRRSTTDAIDRNTFTTYNYEDKDSKINIDIIFHRSWAEPETIIEHHCGMVLILPSFWLAVSQNTATSYIVGQIKTFYEEDVVQWNIDRDIKVNCPIN